MRKKFRILIIAGLFFFFSSSIVVAAVVHSVRVNSQFASTLLNGIWTFISFRGNPAGAEELWDANSLHNNCGQASGTNCERLTASKAVAYYFLSCNLTISANSSGVRGVGIWHSADGFIALSSDQNSGASSYTSLNASTVHKLTSGQYVRCYGFQNSGRSLNTVPGTAFGMDFDMTEIE